MKNMLGFYIKLGPLPAAALNIQVFLFNLAACGINSLVIDSSKEFTTKLSTRKIRQYILGIFFCLAELS